MISWLWHFLFSDRPKPPTDDERLQAQLEMLHDIEQRADAKKRRRWREGDFTNYAGERGPGTT